MEEAEHALWRAAGLSIMPSDPGMAFPRVAAAFDYHHPLRFEEEVEVVIRVAAIANKTFTYTCLISRGDTRIATGTLTVACVRKGPEGKMKAVAIPPEIAARFEVAQSV